MLILFYLQIETSGQIFKYIQEATLFALNMGRNKPTIIHKNINLNSLINTSSNKPVGRFTNIPLIGFIFPRDLVTSYSINLLKINS